MIETHTAAELTAALEQLGPADQPGLIYNTPEERLATILAFLGLGLERGERCLYLAGEAAEGEALLAAARTHGPTLDNALQTGALEIGTASGMRGDWSEARQAALAAGFAGLRAAIEIAPASEAELPREPQMEEVLTLWLYDRQRVPPAALLPVIGLHPVVMYGGRVCHNPYYVPPEEARHASRAELELQRLLENISALEETRQALAESEELHRLTLAEISDAVFITNDQGQFVYVCPNVNVIFGYSLEEVREMGQISRLIGNGLFAPEALAAAGEIANLERQIVDQSGQEHDLLINVKQVSIKGGSILYTCRDITARKRADEAALESRAILDAAVQNAPFEFWVRDRAGRMILQNAESLRMANLLGTLPEESGASLEEVAEWKESNARALAGEIVRQESEFLSRGSRRHAIAVVSPVRAGDQIHGIAGFLLDISDRKQAEERLAYQAHLLENVHDAIVATDPEYRTTSWNKAAEALYGWSAAEVLGRPLSEFARTDWPDVERAIHEARLASGAVSHEVLRTRKDGVRLNLEGSIIALRDEQGQLTGYVSVNRDISERRRREADLRESDERYRLLVELSPEAITVHTAGRLLYANPAAAALYGSDDPAAMIGQEFAAYYHPSLREANRQEVLEKTDNNYIGLREPLDFVRHDGRVMNLEVSSSPIQYLGQPARLVLAQDVTERIAREQALKRSEERFAKIFHASPIAIGITSAADGRFLQVNARCCEFYGRGPEEIVGRTAVDLKIWSSPEQREQVIRQLRENGSVGNLEISHRTPAGQTRYGLLSLEWLNLEDEPEPLVLAMVVEITERKQADQALFESRRRFQAIFDSSRDAILLNDDDQRYVEVNPAACELFGYSREEFTGLTVWDVTAPSRVEEGRQLYQQYLASGSLSGEYQILRKDGQAVTVEYRAVANILPGLHLAITRDITERKLAEAQLEQKTRRLEAMAELSGALAEAGTDYPSMLNLVVRRTAEVLGDACVLTLRPEAGGGPHPAAFAHRRPEAEKVMRHIFQAGQEPRGPAAQVLQSGQPLFTPFIDPEQVQATFNPAYQPFVEQVGVASLVIVPLRARGEVLGTLGVSRDRDGQPYTEEDLAFLQSLADRAALAIANAGLYDRVRAGRERMQALSRRLVETQEAERRSIARELHDEVGQLLTGLQLTLSMAARVGEAGAAAHIGDAQNLTREVTARVRDLSLGLRPAMLDDLGLLPAIQWQTERFASQTRVRVDLRQAGLGGRRFRPEVETAAYRIVQEALTNAARHAEVTEVVVRLWATDKLVGVQIEDQGSGFDPQAALAAGISGGLAGMRERVGLLGGRFTIEAAPGEGTRLTAELPLSRSLERRSARGQWDEPDDEQ